MLIYKQDRSMAINFRYIRAVEVVERNVVAIGEDWTEPLGEYSSSDAAEKVLKEITEEYSKFFRVDGGPLATVNAYVQPMMFEPPKVYKMPAYR